MNSVIDLLNTHQILYTRHDHPPVYTCAQASALDHDFEGEHTKNLFLRDAKKKNYLLLVISEAKQVNLKSLGEKLGLGKLSFASPDDLKAILDIEPGAVSPLALINDKAHSVRLFIDKDIWTGAPLQCHPLVNTSTLVVPQSGLQKFFELIGSAFELIDLE